jgi:hypothetical protein
MNGEGKIVAEFGDEQWLWDLALLCDTSHQLNTILRGQQKLNFDMFGVLRAFDMNLKLFRERWKMLTCVIFVRVICSS